MATCIRKDPCIYVLFMMRLSMHMEGVPNAWKGHQSNPVLCFIPDTFR